ncbi:MAG: hypothetical protein IPP03_01225 [Dechloromonas sp.]|nr:hypothetical protein [Candidatus Dechloromonas phosphoritropha]MBP8787517.1 hypothetical protein [Azonexus sp.]MBP9229341.1 hypothetical protein [Azonexus sp.]
MPLISGGRPENLGKTVFVVGYPDDPRLPCLGGKGCQWDAQMLAMPLVGADGEEYLRGAIGERCLTPLNVPEDQAMAKLFERIVEELLQEDFGDDDAVDRGRLP